MAVTLHSAPGPDAVDEHSLLAPALVSARRTPRSGAVPRCSPVSPRTRQPAQTRTPPTPSLATATPWTRSCSGFHHHHYHQILCSRAGFDGSAPLPWMLWTTCYYRGATVECPGAGQMLRCERTSSTRNAPPPFKDPPPRVVRAAQAVLMWLSKSFQHADSISCRRSAGAQVSLRRHHRRLPHL